MSIARWLVGCLALLALSLPAPRAHACGCFTPPDPVSTVVQAGERILFAADGQTVEAHIQIQFSGKAAEFGWLLPLPSVPKLEVGTDELFARLLERVGPRFEVKEVYANGCVFPPGDDGGGWPAEDMSLPSDDGGPGFNPLVVQDSIGPYDYAVLKADQKQPMLDWLKLNRYFVPVGTDAAVAPYLRPGAYFLALKLRSGKSTGDLQPVVLRYPSDLPMIPIILTSVTAVKDMPVQVWLLGPARAIPRNYYHTVINEAALDWFSPETSYQALLTRAVGEAKGKHSFVTEFAGAPSVMKDALARAGRFGDLAKLRLEKDGFAYLRALVQGDYPPTTSLFTILKRYLPVPKEVTQAGFDDATFYWNAETLKWNQFPGLTLPAYDPVKLTNEIEAAIVTPARNAEALFTRYKKLSFLHTTLSPLDMNSDPVFSFNPNLADVSNVHRATRYYRCPWPGEFDYQPEKVVLANGQTVYYENRRPRLGGPLPGSLRIEILRDLGPPQLVLDNGPAIAKLLLGPPPPPPDAAMPSPPVDAAMGRLDAGIPRDLRSADLRRAAGDQAIDLPQPEFAGRGCQVGRARPSPLGLLLGLALLAGWRLRRPTRRSPFPRNPPRS